MSIYKSLVLEIRPRLQSVNVLITLNEKSENLTVELSENSFEIRCGSQINKISCCQLTIAKNSLTSLIITDNYVSFRFATEGSFNFGTFKTELLRTTQTSIPKLKNEVFLQKGVEYSVHCRNCREILGSQLEFKRVLPLPSENSEPNDWFCHGHGDCNTKFDLNPQQFDVFYTDSYCHLSRKLIRNVLGDKLIVCRRCFSWLGLVKNTETVQVWFNTVGFKTNTDWYTSDCLKDTFNLIKDVLSNVLFNSAKVLVSCQSTTDQIDYILLWVLEKELNIQLVRSEDNNQECKVAKVLFKFEQTCSDLIKEWENDTSVNCVNISKPMFIAFLKSLYRFNKVFPKEFSKSNNFYISYLMMYTELKD